MPGSQAAKQQQVHPAASCGMQGGAAVQGAYGEDLSGGYYEAGGSYMKMALQEAFVLTQLAWTGAHTLAVCPLTNVYNWHMQQVLVVRSGGLSARLDQGRAA